MKFSHTMDNNVLVITPESKVIDSNNVNDFKRGVISLVEEMASYNLVLNMENITFMDSMGLGSLASILKMMKNHKGDLKLASISNTVRAIIEIVRLHKLINISADTEEAVSAFNGPPENKTP